MPKQIAIGLVLGTLLRSSNHDGLAVSTVVLLVVIAFWIGAVCGWNPLLFFVSPSLHRFLSLNLLRWLFDDDLG